MFNVSTAHKRRLTGTSVLTTAVAAGLHALALVVIAVTALSAGGVVPAPRAIEAFVSVPPPPPPPPPPPAPAEVEAPRKPKSLKTVRPHTVRRVSPVKAAPVAPIDAPAAVLPDVETSAESADDSAEFADLEAGIPGGIAGGIAGGIVGGTVGSPVPTIPPPPPALTKPVRVGGRIVAPRVVHRVNPEYPGVARDARVQGVVILEATVSAQGRVEGVRVLRSNPLLEEAAVRAVQRWRYEPLLLNGAPTPFVLTVTIAFNLR